jgi:hypothetical protein
LPNFEYALEPGVPLVVTVPAPAEPRVCSVLISIARPGRIEPGLPVPARFDLLDDRGATTSVMAKDLSLGDPDAVWAIRQPKETSLRILISPPATDQRGRSEKPLQVSIRVTVLDGDAARAPDSGQVASEQVHDPRALQRHVLCLGRRVPTRVSAQD